MITTIAKSSAFNFKERDVPETIKVSQCAGWSLIMTENYRLHNWGAGLSLLLSISGITNLLIDHCSITVTGRFTWYLTRFTCRIVSFQITRPSPEYLIAVFFLKSRVPLITILQLELRISGLPDLGQFGESAEKVFSKSEKWLKLKGLEEI